MLRARPGRSFALLGQQFVTQWIALSDGDGRYVDHLKLTLTASGSTVTAARWEEVFRSGGAPPHSIPLSIHWEHSLEEDAASALDLLLGSAALALFCLLWRTLQMKMREELAASGFGGKIKAYAKKVAREREQKEFDGAGGADAQAAASAPAKEVGFAAGS